MHIHDAHRLALLVIAVGGEGEIEADRKQHRRQSAKPRQDARRQAQKPGGVGKVAEFAVWPDCFRS